MAIFEEASPICRGKNLSWETIMLFFNSMPKQAMPKADFNSYVESKINAWTQTHSQIARQLAFYYEENGICYPRFTQKTDLRELFEYMKNWAVKYFIPNPYAPSLKGNTPTCIYSYIAKSLNEGRTDFDEILDSIFQVKLSSHDKVNVFLTNFTDLLIDSNHQVSFNKGLQHIDNIEAGLHPEAKFAIDAKLYFEYFSISNKKNQNCSLPSLDPSQYTKYTNIITAAKTKPFILLAGISGTGKSRIVKEMAFACCPDVAELRNDPVSPGNYLLVEVKPNWHDSTELLGYESTIKKGYVLTPFVKFLYKAMKHPDVPFFVCLDEMNLAPVEQYFAEYLSILESRKQQSDGTILTEPLISAEVFRKYPELCAEMNGTAVRRENVKNTYMTTDPAVEYIATEREYENLCEEGLRIPQNVVVIGTVNMDETTHQFSRKVIDRAMTIEMNEVKFDGFFESSSELTYPDRVLPKEYFLPCHTTAGKALESVPDDAEYIKANVPAMLEQLNEALADTPFKIAYRVQNELVLYFAALRQEEAHKATGTAELLATAMDQILMMKVLPRIEGDDELLEKPLERLAVYAEGYPKASAKIKEMQERLGRSHFTSFWP